MITDHTIDEALIEIMRTKKALEALRTKRKEAELREDVKRRHNDHWVLDRHCIKEHAAAKRASMDLTRSLAKLREGK
jgi:hypothetical protein